MMLQTENIFADVQNAEKQNSTTEYKHVAIRVIFMPCHMVKNWTYPAGGLTGYIPYR